MTFQPISTGRRRERSEAFKDEQVSGYISKLKERIKNLADKDGGKSILLSDALNYGVKPVLAQLRPTSQVLTAVWSGGPIRNGVQYGSPQYSWLVHAFASALVNDLIVTNVNSIFGASGPLRTKLNQGVAVYRSKHGTNDFFGLWNYVKRTFSRPIKTWYITHRKVILEQLPTIITPQWLGTQVATAVIEAATKAKQTPDANNNNKPMSVGNYIRTHGGKLNVGDSWSLAQTAPQAETAGFTGGASSSSSSVQQ